jgi:hypothetical protein
MLTRLGRELAPGLLVEHAIGACPVNDHLQTCRTPERDIVRSAEWLAYSDVFRTYDVTGPLSVPSTLDRVVTLLSRAAVNPDALGLVHCEDEVYMGAILGCVLGVMRYPVGDLPAGVEPNIHLGGGERFSATRPFRKQMDEVVRAVRWQRIAPAFKADLNKTICDDLILWDTWKFERGETWLREILNASVKQGAPARVARGLPLPQVAPDANGGQPFVMASRFPNGAISVGTLGRIDTEKGYYVPHAKITVDAGSASGPLGIFGYSAGITFRFDHDLKPQRIWAQDLAGDSAEDITSQAIVSGRSVTIPGEVITRIGLSARSSVDDKSEPGLVVVLE